jgi:hypothetical protein
MRSGPHYIQGTGQAKADFSTSLHLNDIRDLSLLEGISNIAGNVRKRRS